MNLFRQRKTYFYSFLCFVYLLLCYTVPNNIYAKQTTITYTIKPNSPPCNVAFTRYRNYNDNTKTYYTLRSYLEKLERQNGGTLILEKGTYIITNTLYVPSNVTILFNDGVTIKKGNSTKTSDMPASSSIFQFISPANSKKTGVYGKYNGDSNISFIGKGTVVFDMNYYKDGIAIIMGHNQNITIDNITFKNMYSGHFIEMDASKNISITNCTFKNYKASANGNKEAINLDTPDKTTNGWSQKWSKYDCTPNIDVTIESCTFTNLERAVGTHRYSIKKYHTNVKLLNNTVKNVRSAFFGLNWKTPTIKGNTITNATEKGSTVNTGDGYGIFLAGTINPSITDNFFSNCPTGAILLRPSYYTSHDDPKDAILSTISTTKIKAMANNRIYKTPETMRYEKTSIKFSIADAKGNQKK